MHWVILTDDYPPCDGGVATWTAAVAQGLRAAGDEVSVFCRFRQGLSEARGVRGPWFGRFGHRWLALAARNATKRADRVLATTWTVAQTVVRGRIPVDVIFHGSDATHENSERAIVSKQAARRFSVSGFLQQRLAAEWLGAAVLPVPVDLVPMNPLGKRWGFVGRATALKGGDRFIRLVAAAGVEGEIIGDGPELSSWKALAEQCGARIAFRGRLSHDAACSAMLGFERLFLLSRTRADGSGAEGLGLVLAEAAARGIPSIGSPVGGIPELATRVLTDPDDIGASLQQMRIWNIPELREEACHRLNGHGVAATVRRLKQTSG